MLLAESIIWKGTHYETAKAYLPQFEGPFEPSKGDKVYLLEKGPSMYGVLNPVFRPAEKNDSGEWVANSRFAFNGNLITCSDSRFSEGIQRFLAEHKQQPITLKFIPIHDHNPY